jgi:hypothetical protein
VGRPLAWLRHPQIRVGWRVAQVLVVRPAEQGQVAQPIGDELVVAVGVAVEERAGEQRVDDQRLVSAAEELAAGERTGADLGEVDEQGEEDRPLAGDVADQVLLVGDGALGALGSGADVFEQAVDVSLVGQLGVLAQLGVDLAPGAGTLACQWPRPWRTRRRGRAGSRGTGWLPDASSEIFDVFERGITIAYREAGEPDRDRRHRSPSAGRPTGW